MECNICNKDGTSHDDFFCASCARSFVYLSRLELARVLLDNERMTKQITSVIDHPTRQGTADPALQHAQQRWQEEKTGAEQIAAKERIEETRVQITSLKQDIENLKAEIAQKKQKVASRRDTLNHLNQIMPARRKTTIDVLTDVREKGTSSFGNVSSRSSNTRAFLCRETAALLRLRQKKKTKNGAVSEQYSITGLLLPDLKEINNIKCTDLTASLTATAHLLILIAFYLGIRLPAEITIPHRDYPLPTINTPAQSYLGQKIAFPGSGSINTAPSSPFSSKHDVKGPYRPRPLFIGSDDRDEKVAQFAKRDPTAFSFFVEGIVLLAWNVAWLCRTQGFSQGTNSWEDICDIGRNLHQLVFGQPQSPALFRVLSSRENPRLQKPNSGILTPSLDGNIISFAKLGQTSHLSTQAFLGQASSNEQLRTWKFGKFNTIADGLKKLLVTEMNNAEWELLQEQEWDDGGEQFDEAVFIRSRITDGRENDDARSILTTRTAIDDQTPQSTNERDSDKPKGTSGWTKVKSRTEN